MSTTPGAVTNSELPQPEPLAPTDDRRTTRRLCWLIALLSLVAYCRVVSYDFVPFDDPRYVQEHPRVWAGLTPDNVAWALTTDYFSNWHPLTWLSYMLDCQLFGPNPGWMHGMNLLLHTLNGVLLFLVLKRMTGAVGSSAFVALLFALHPLHVESVAWISERKDVLSTLFWILAMGAYTSYARAPSWGRYALVMFALFLGLMAKAMLVTLPCVLLLLDYWPLDRFAVQAQAGRGPWRAAMRLFAEKLPLFGVVALSAVLTALAQSSSGAMESLDRISLPVRVGNALIAYCGYLSHTFWPAGLAAYYMHPGYSPPDFQPTAHFYRLAAGSAAVLVLASVAVLWFGRRQKYLTVGWLWYLGTLVPVIGLVQVGMQGMADRYTYVPLIGIFIMVAWGVPELLRRAPAGKLALDLAALGAVGACFALTWLQVGHWRNGITLYTHTIAVSENNTRAQGLLGVALARENRHAEAIALYEAALKLDSGSSQLRNHLGASLVGLGRFAEADVFFRDSIAIKPEVAATHYNYARSLASQKSYEAAIAEYLKSIELEPNSAKAHNNLGNLFAELDRKQEAAEHYAAALRLNPRYQGARHNLERLLAHTPAGANPPATATAPPAQ